MAWREGAAPGETLLTWRETGGPPPAPHRRQGFGSRLIDRVARHDLGGEAAMDFRPEGLAATVRFRRAEGAAAS